MNALRSAPAHLREIERPGLPDEVMAERTVRLFAHEALRRHVGGATRGDAQPKPSV
jgi:hypothetical protein